MVCVSMQTTLVLVVDLNLVGRYPPSTNSKNMKQNLNSDRECLRITSAKVTECNATSGG